MDKLNAALSFAVNLGYGGAISRQREALRGGAVGAAIDGKRSLAWAEYGFPEIIDGAMLYNLYRRNGLAHGAVSKLIGSCWGTMPWVIEGDKFDEKRQATPWEKAMDTALPLDTWRMVQQADLRATIGRYSALIMRVKDNKDFAAPLTGGIVEAFVPAWASSLKVKEWDTDLTSPSYGQPKVWTYSEAGMSAREVEIHPDRVLVFGDISKDAIAYLEPAYNAFVSLEKVEGGSGEAYLKNASRQVVTSFDKDVDLNNIAAMYGVSLDQLQEKFNEAARQINQGVDTMMITQGATVSPLVANVPDPRPTHEVNISTVAAALDIPKRMLVGNQQGDMASTEDLKAWLSRCQSRRVCVLSPQIQAMFEQLQRVGVLQPADFTVMWDDLREATTTAKLDSAAKMATINDSSVATGQPVFTSEEIRVAAGYEGAPDDRLGE